MTFKANSADIWHTIDFRPANNVAALFFAIEGSPFQDRAYDNARSYSVVASVGWLVQQNDAGDRQVIAAVLTEDAQGEPVPVTDIPTFWMVRPSRLHLPTEREARAAAELAGFVFGTP